MKDYIHSGRRQKWAIIIAFCGVLALAALIAQWRVISQARGENSALRSTQELVMDESGEPAPLTQEQEATSGSSERG